ncbi:hypothetical protein RCL_jg11807.t1 [Rhizophagus clarus]|uniref:Uncharacterized protein n=1 Tax=Rhizophagus clarus TaxID=94130 RepID=A0A8H3R498_9GLOM|nr:hypothetical protein RCL_jg11807.t1 [Rhizophagus clarus]
MEKQQYVDVRFQDLKLSRLNRSTCLTYYRILALLATAKNVFMAINGRRQRKRTTVNSKLENDQYTSAKEMVYNFNIQYCSGKNCASVNVVF